MKQSCFSSGYNCNDYINLRPTIKLAMMDIRRMLFVCLSVCLFVCYIDLYDLELTFHFVYQEEPILFLKLTKKKEGTLVPETNIPVRYIRLSLY